ncbi:hypothetical protein TNCV_4032701 [Trichonephila clavipes]|nr:hypothetical protein TNCV_4032701 [Trichonephila clavipes]
MAQNIEQRTNTQHAAGGYMITDRRDTWNGYGVPVSRRETSPPIVRTVECGYVNIRLFEGSLAVGKKPINYDGEVLAVCETTTPLLSAGLTPAKVVFFIDFQAAILA